VSRVPSYCFFNDGRKHQTSNPHAFAPVRSLRALDFRWGQCAKRKSGPENRDHAI